MKLRTLVPVIIAVLALAITPLVASADAGKKDALSSANAGYVVGAAEKFAKNANTHGGVVSKVASDWQAFLNTLDSTLKDAVKKLNKGQIMRVIAQSNDGKGKESADADDTNNGKNDGDKSNNGKKDENANGGNKDSEHGKGNVNKNAHGNGASADEETNDTDSDTATDDTSGNSANHGKSDANKGRGHAENKGKATGRQ